MKKWILLFVGASLLFSSCGFEKDPSDSKNNPQVSNDRNGEATTLLEKISEAQEKKGEAQAARTVGISLEKAFVKNEKLTFEVWIDNPEGRPLSSVRSFLAFDPEVLKGVSLEIPSDSPFLTAAPEEKGFDSVRGLVKIGLASSAPSRKKSILLARVSMERLTPQFTTLDFYNPGADGHTTALEENSDGTLRNVLRMPSVPALALPPEETK